MEMERLIKLDEEAILYEEDIPLVRSLSMSRNMALSMHEEVSHMIKLAPSNQQELYPPPSTFPHWPQQQQQPYRKKQPSSSATYRPIIRPQSLSPSLTVTPEVLFKNILRESSSCLVESGSSLATLSIQGGAGVKRKNDLLSSIVLTRWDNIVGPQCIYYWSEESTSVFHPSSLSGVIKYVTDHTVDHQDVVAGGSGVPPSTQRITLCIVPELSLVYLSISFRVPCQLDTVLEFASTSSMTMNDPDQPVMTVPHALSVLAELKYISHFLLLRPLIVGWLNEFAPKMGLLVCKNKLQSSMVNSWCAELCKTMTAVTTCWLQEENDRANNNEQANNVGKPEEKLPFLPPNLRQVSSSSWALLLSSHLSTFGSSIIVGLDNSAVNQVIRFLLCFASSQEGYCSRYSLATLPDTFMKGLYIQGLSLGGIGERSISFKQVSSNKFPLTHVELGSKFKVKQVNPEAHRQTRDNILMQELRALWADSNFISPPEDPYSQIVKDAAEFVSAFIENLTQLPHKWRYARLLLFKRLLHVKALSLITYLQSLRLLPKTERLNLKKMIPEVLHFEEQEYGIVQVVAEKLKPGILKLITS